jgi:hypothetical protein
MSIPIDVADKRLFCPNALDRHLPLANRLIVALGWRYLAATRIVREAARRIAVLAKIAAEAGLIGLAKNNTAAVNVRPAVASILERDFIIDLLCRTCLTMAPQRCRSVKFQ